MRSAARRRTAKGLLVGLGTVVALAATEIGLRVARAWSPRLDALLYAPAVRTRFDRIRTTPELLATSALGYHPLGRTPGFVLNSRGFRTDEYTVEKPPGVFRVIALGDSFTFDSHGVPIRQMWHQVFERRLADRTGRDVEVLSLSAPGVGPRFELRLWELEGRRLDPDLVVLAFFVGNDFTDEAGAPLERTVEAELGRRSATFRLLRNLVRLRHVRGAAAAEAGDRGSSPSTAGGFELPGYAETYDPAVPTFEEAAFARIERGRLLAVAGPDEEGFDRRFADAAAVVERLARDVELAGARFLVLLIPDQFQVETGLAGRLLAALPPPAPRLDLDRPQRRLAAFFGSARIPHLDLLPLFRRHATGEALYKPRDTHWSAAGNRVAGERLAAFVAAHGLGPAPE
jgi:hypothetical protein